MCDYTFFLLKGAKLGHDEACKGVGCKRTLRTDGDAEHLCLSVSLETDQDGHLVGANRESGNGNNVGILGINTVEDGSVIAVDKELAHVGNVDRGVRAEDLLKLLALTRERLPRCNKLGSSKSVGSRSAKELGQHHRERQIHAHLCA